MKDMNTEEEFTQGDDNAAPCDEELAEAAPDWKAMYEEAQENYLRALADLQNYRKRVAQDVAQQRKFANENLLCDLLPITDNCNQALCAMGSSDDLEGLIKGVEMIINQLQYFLECNGVEQVDTVGEQFDPQKHEAVEAVPRDDVAENTVVEVVQPGYLLEGRLLRAARVKVAVPPGDRK